MIDNITKRYPALNVARTVLHFVLLVIFSLSQSAFAMPGAKGDKFEMNINISGSVVVNGSCSFNQGDLVDVDFGQVQLMKIDSSNFQLQGNYTKPLVSEFTCTGDSDGLLQMQFTDSDEVYASYNGTYVLPTTNKMTGLLLLVNGTPQNSGQWFTVDQHNPPQLEVQVVQLKTTGSATTGEVFTASGTLTMAFN